MISNKFLYFSLAFNETTDIKDSPEFAIFVRGADSEMNVPGKNKKN